MNWQMLDKDVCKGIFNIPPLLEENKVNMMIALEHFYCITLVAWCALKLYGKRKGEREEAIKIILQRTLWICSVYGFMDGCCSLLSVQIICCNSRFTKKSASYVRSGHLYSGQSVLTLESLQTSLLLLIACLRVCFSYFTLLFSFAVEKGFEAEWWSCGWKDYFRWCTWFACYAECNSSWCIVLHEPHLSSRHY